MRSFRCIALPVLPALMGLACATTQPEAELSIPGPEPISTASSIGSPPPPSVLGNNGAITLDGPNALVRLCESMRDEEGMAFTGTAVAQAQARDQHARQRQAAEVGRFVAVIPAQGFAFGEYDLPARRLLLNTARGFHLGEGAELAPNNENGSVGFVLPPEAADRMLVSRAGGGLYLRIVFRPARSKLRNETCLWMSGGRVVKLGVELEAVALLGPDGARLARSDMSETGAEIDTPVTKPQVLVRQPRSADGRELPRTVADSVSSLGVAVLPCYEKALQDQPNLRGTLVLALLVSPDGQIEESRMEISSLGNDRLTSCAAAHVGKAKLSGNGVPQKLSVSLVFGSKDDR